MFETQQSKVELIYKVNVFEQISITNFDDYCCSKVNMKINEI